MSLVSSSSLLSFTPSLRLTNISSYTSSSSSFSSSPSNLLYSFRFNPSSSQCLTRFSPSIIVNRALLHDAGAAALVSIGAYGLVRVFDELTNRKIIEQLHLFRSSSSAFKSSQCLVRSSPPTIANGTVLHDIGATTLVSIGAYGLVRIFDELTNRKVIKQSLSRKVVHILSGLLFLGSWPFFSTSVTARYFAAFVPFLNCLRLLIHGLQLASDEGLVKSVTREGNPKELLRGPLYYVLILICCATLFWRESPIGVMALAMMCGGDGFADIMGRRFGTLKIPYNKQKSLVGSFSMFSFGFLTSVGMLYYFSVLGYFQLDWPSTLQIVALVSLVATMVESLPITGVIDDNISVPLSTMLMAYMLFS